MTNGPFLNWLESKKIQEYSTLGTEYVDEREIDSIYDKAKLSVKLVQMYSKDTNQKILNNISTIANLQHSAYGLYNSGENKKVIGSMAADKIRMKFGKDLFAQNKINNIPSAVIRQYFPELQPNQIQPSDIIRVNVRKILAQFGDSLESVLEIASTIIHEATHEIERETLGKTSEVGPVAAEKRFLDWFKTNKNRIYQKLPQLASLSLDGKNQNPSS